MRSILRSHPWRLFLPVAAGVVVGAPFLVFFAFESHAAMVAQVGASTALVFGVLLGLTAAATSVHRDRAAGTRDLTFARGLGPGAWLVGKWAAILACVLLSLAVLAGVHFVSLAVRDGAPLGYGPLLAAFLVAAVAGGLASAAALLFAVRLRAGPAFLAALLLLVAGHGAELLGDALPARALRLLLPATADLNLAGEAGFGPFTPGLWLAPAAHGLLYSAFLLALGTLLASRAR